MNNFLLEAGAGDISRVVTAGAVFSGMGQEQLLLARLAGGDTAAFWDLWAMHRDHLSSVCTQAMNGNQAEAEDALTEVMLKARREMVNRLGNIAVPQAWLTRLAQNLCMDIQRNSARQARLVKQLQDWPADMGGETMEPAWGEEETEIRPLVEGLPADLREPLALSLFHEQTCGEIATRLGLSSATVRKRLQRARVSLRQNWNACYTSDPPSARPQTRPAKSKVDAARVVPARSPEPWEITMPTAVARLTPVWLPCGVVRYFQIFLADEPGRERQKIQALRAYLRRRPGSSKRLRELVQLLYQTGAWPEAIRSCRRALAKPPFWLSGAVLLGEMLFLMGKGEEARVVYTQALPHARHPASQQHLGGLIAACEENWPGAVRCFSAAATQSPDNLAHLHALAWARLQAGQAEAALPTLEAALRINPRDLTALGLKQAVLRAVGRMEEAGQWIELALKADPKNILALAHLPGHLLHSAANEPDLAAKKKRLFRLAFRHAPHSPTVLAALAAHHFSRGARTRGAALIRELSEQHPGCPQIEHLHNFFLTATGIKPKTGASCNQRTPPCPGACRMAGIRAGF